MDFAVDPDAADLATGLRDLLVSQLGGRALRDVLAEPARRDALWNSITEQGVPATLVPERLEGLELGWAAAVLLLEEIGRAAAPGPLIDSLAVAPDLMAFLGPEFDSALEKAAEGELKIGVADALGHVDAWNELHAVLILIPRTADAEARVGLYPVSEVTWSHLPTLDDGVAVARVAGAGSPDIEVAVGQAATDRFEAAGALASAAALIGVARRMLDLTTDYVSQRVAFGKVIGSFQAIQHPLVEVALKIEMAAPIVRAAAWALDEDRPNALERASHAKLAAIQASELAWRVCLQSHGAIGYTAEYDLQLWLKRSLTLAVQHGTAAQARRRLREILLRRLDLGAASRQQTGPQQPEPLVDAFESRNG